MAIAEHEMTHTHNDSLRVVVFMEQGMWAAQCLEYDIGAQGKTIKEAVSLFVATLELDRRESISRYSQEFAGIDPAPQYFEEMWEQQFSVLTPADSYLPFPSKDYLSCSQAASFQMALADPLPLASAA